MAVANLRLGDFFPRKFDGGGGDSPLAHWLQYEDYCGVHDVEADVRLTRFRMTLSGQARLWMEGKQFEDLNDLKRRFLEHFSGVHSREASVAAFRSIVYKPGESMDAYLDRIKPLAERLGYQDELVKDQFLHGLPHDVKVAVSMANCDTVADMVVAAQRFSDLQAGRVSVREVTFAVGEADAVQSQIEILREDMRTLRMENERGTRGRPRAESSPGRASRLRVPPTVGVRSGRDSQVAKSGRCNYCNMQGHFWRQCRKLAADMERKGSRMQSSLGDRGRAGRNTRQQYFH